MSFTGLLNNTFDLISLGMTADAYGGWSSSPSTVSAMSSVPCRIYELSVSERELLNREGVSATHKIYCDYYSTITEQHECLSGGKYYQIVRVNDPSLAHHHLEITAARMS